MLRFVHYTHELKILVPAIRESVLVDKDNNGMPHGLLYIRGGVYKAYSDVEIDESRRKLFKAISSQLAACPQSIIVIDELEAILDTHGSLTFWTLFFIIFLKID